MSAELALQSRGPSSAMTTDPHSINATSRRNGAHAACHHGVAARASARGFTLIEVVAAFAILALGLTLTMQIAAGGMRQSRQAADYTEAALLAQSLLDTAGVGERLELGESSGEWEGGFRWSLTVSPYELETPEGMAVIDSLTAPVRLVELDLRVTWQNGQNERESRFRSLRAMLPESL